MFLHFVFYRKPLVQFEEMSSFDIPWLQTLSLALSGEPHSVPAASSLQPVKQTDIADPSPVTKVIFSHWRSDSRWCLYVGLRQPFAGNLLHQESGFCFGAEIINSIDYPNETKIMFCELFLYNRSQGELTAVPGQYETVK